MGSKRQLPPWMFRAAATDQASKSVSVDKNKENGLEELPSEASQPKSSSVEVQQDAADVTTCESESAKVDLCSAKKHKSTKSRRKVVKRVKDGISNLHDEGDLGKENHAPPPRKRKAKALKATRSNAVEESTLSEDELSVDDLISIAKEYINDEKRKKGHRSLLAEYESERAPQSVSSKDKSTYKDNTPSSENNISNVNILESSPSDLVEGQPSESGFTSSSKTGELAQDVLELLLGPLFKRCSQVKPNPEPVAKSVIPDYSSSNQTQDQLDGDVNAIARKKGSIKDKVTLMLS